MPWQSVSVIGHRFKIFSKLFLRFYFLVIFELRDTYFQFWFHGHALFHWNLSLFDYFNLFFNLFYPRLKTKKNQTMSALTDRLKKLIFQGHATSQSCERRLQFTHMWLELWHTACEFKRLKYWSALRIISVEDNFLMSRPVILQVPLYRKFLFILFCASFLTVWFACPLKIYFQTGI